ncbi:MAG: hypothetical protein AB1486_02280 [Planctomycetota bacterium]
MYRSIRSVAGALGVMLLCASLGLAQFAAPATTSSSSQAPAATQTPAGPSIGPAAAGGKVYYTDCNSFGPTTPFYEYDVVTDTWSAKASIPFANTTQLTADESGNVYSLPEDGNIYRYDPTGDTWNLVMAGPAAAVGRNAIAMFETHAGEFYWARDFTTTLYYTSGGVWNSVATPRTISSGADVDRATGWIYIRIVSDLGFFAFDPGTVSFPKICDQSGGVGENARVGVLYNNEFFARTFTGTYMATDVGTCSLRDTGVAPTSTHSSSAGDGAGNIYSNGWNDDTIFEVYNVPSNTLTSLAAAPDIAGNAHSTLVHTPGALSTGLKVYYSDCNSFGPTTPFYAYDVNTDTWTQRADVPGANTTQLAADELGRVYSLPEDGNIYRYDPASNTWSFVMTGPAASIGRNNISMFEAHGGEFYWGKDGTSTLYYTSGGVWSSIATPRTVSCAADVDRSLGWIVIRTYTDLGFFAFDPGTLSFPAVCDQGSGSVGENARAGVLYGREFFTRTFAGTYMATDLGSCGIRDTGVAPTSTHSSSAGDGAGNIYSNGWTDDTVFEVYNVPSNTLTALAPAPDIAGNAHSTLVVGGTCPEAQWSNYGAGWPGTFGIPNFTAASDPEIGGVLTLNLDNSRGSNTTGYLVMGLASASLPTGVGGTLLVLPGWIFGIVIPGGGLSFGGSVPLDPALCGFALFLQVVETDPGASHGLSFTPGLELDFGV